MKKRILFITSCITGWGGIDRVVTLVATQLSKRGHSVGIISYFEDEAKAYPLPDEVEVFAMDYHGKGSSRNSIIKRISDFRKIVRSFKPDYVITTLSIINYFIPLVMLGFPKTKWISWNHIKYSEDMIPIARICFKIALWFSDVMVFLSKEDAAKVKKLRPRGRCISMPNPSAFEVQESDISSRRLVLAAGTLLPVKQYDHLIYAWSKIEKDHPDWELTIVGEGSLKEELLAQIKELGLERCHLPGYEKDIRKYYDRAAVFCCTSSSEGFPMVVLDALTLGIPVVSYECSGGISELVSDNVNGFLVPPDDKDEFARKLDSLLKDESLRCEMSAKASAGAKKYSAENIIKRWEKLFEKI